MLASTLHRKALCVQIVCKADLQKQLQHIAPCADLAGTLERQRQYVVSVKRDNSHLLKAASVQRALRASTHSFVRAIAQNALLANTP